MKWKDPEASLTTEKRLLIGPVNTAGQAHGWAHAVSKYVIDASAHSYAFDRTGLGYASDYLVPNLVYGKDKEWRGEFSDVVMSRYTHVLLESNRPVFGLAGGREVTRDLALLLTNGVEVALIAHGSDVRVPSRHVELEQWSPFRYMDHKEVDYVEHLACRAGRVFNNYPGPVFVSTPDLLAFIPKATWLPVVVEPERWSSEHPVLERAVPVVAHAPSKSSMKGSHLIDPLLEQLDADGVIEYRRVQGIDHGEMPEVYSDADIVVDQMLLGSYGVAACEALAAGRVVLGHVSEQVREYVCAETGLDLPIVEATPDTIVEQIKSLISDHDRARGIAMRGPDFIRAVHDGRRSASALTKFLSEGDGTPEDWRPAVLEPKVVMMAGNDIVSDARVMKYAQTVARWGIDVTALGIAGKKLRGTEWIGPVLVRCPVVPPRFSVPRRILIHNITPWFSNAPDRQRAVDRFTYDERELRAVTGKRNRDALREPLTTVNHGSIPRWLARLTVAARRRVLRARKTLIRARGIPLAIARRRSSRRGPDLGMGRRRQLALWSYQHSGFARWRRVLPETKDWEFVLGPILDKIQPDLIHVHDVFMMGVAARAAHRAALRGRSMKIIYDAHEYIPGIPVTEPRRIAAYVDLERTFIRDADRIITVSEPLAAWLQRDHRLIDRPDVVLNAPIESPLDSEVVGVRDLLGLDADTPLLVYAGAVNRARGVATAVEGLSVLDGVHLALVARPGAITRELVSRAEELGVSDRFHVVPYVDPEFVPLYLQSATVGLSTLLRAPNYDIAVTNKFCEYISAGLPIVTSDTPAQADLVNTLSLGAVYRAGDITDFVRAIGQVLDDQERLTARISGDDELRHRFSWAAQAEIIRDVYESVLGELPAFAWSPKATQISSLVASRRPNDISSG